MDRVAKSIFEKYWQIITTERHRGLSVDLVEPKIWESLSQIIKNIDEKKKPNGALLIGPVGTGKTSLIYITAFHILKAIAENYPRLENFTENFKEEHSLYTEEDLIVHLNSVRWFFSQVNISIQTHWSLTQALRKSAGESGLSYDGHLFDKKMILFLDDLGRGYDDKAGWSIALQDEYIDYRWRNSLPTFVTTNLTPEELRTWPGYERIVDRIADPAWMKTIVVTGESKRRREFYEKGVMK